MVPFVEFFNEGTDQARTGKAILHLSLGEDALMQVGYEQFTGVPGRESESGRGTVYKQRRNDYDLNRADTYIGFGRRGVGPLLRHGISGEHWLQNIIHWVRNISHFERTDSGREFLKFSGRFVR